MKLRSFLVIVVLFIGWNMAAANAAQPFSQVAKDIQIRLKDALQEQAQTFADIGRRRKEMRRQRDGLRSRLETAARQLADEKEELKRLSRQRDDLKKEISAQMAGKVELNTAFSDYAANFLAQAQKSPFSAETPGRLQTIETYLVPNRVLGINDLQTLLDLYFQDMAAAREIIRYQGRILDRSGDETEAGIIRLGHITTIYRCNDTSGYLTLSPSSARLLASAAPPLRVRHNLSSYFDGKTDRLFLDISKGAAIQQLSRRVKLMDQLRSGGILVIPILLVGLVALALTVERLFFLKTVRHNSDGLMTRVTGLVVQGDLKGALKLTEPHRKRPTGRLLAAGLACWGETREVIESALSEAILKETPRLERFSGALKVLAAVAPLLGLLGTVTGMINTFQVITTHGTGEPRLMAGGISEAMVTTQVGLAVAIPVMMIAAYLKQKAHKLTQDMEEKALTLMGGLLKSKPGDDGRQELVP